MIRAEGVTAGYGEAVVVDDVTIELPSGGVTALVGPNGAGKSTLLSVMARLMQPRSGRVLVDELDVHTTPSDELAKRLAILRQDNHIAMRLTVRDLVTFGRYPHSGGRPTVLDEQAVDAAMEHLDLHELADRFLDEVSGGQRQRAFVAMVLAQETDHLLLDEPLNNLDLRQASTMMRRLRRAADELDRSIVVVLHDLNAAAAHADRLVAMRDGRVVAAGPLEEVFRAELLSEVFGVPIRVHRVDGQLVALHY